MPTDRAAPPPTPGKAGLHLVADIGGTNARFATAGPSGRALDHIEILACADFPRIEDALSAYLSRTGITDVADMCLAVAGPVDQDLVDLPNNHWSFSRSALEAHLGAPLTVINDFTAQALCIDLLYDDEVAWFGDPRPRASGIRTVIGPGTGLGIAVQTPGGEIVPSEAGHVGFAPTSEHEIDLLRALFARYRRVSVERVVSGPGLENLYWANTRLASDTPVEESVAHKTAREVVEAATAGDPVALRSIEDFFDVLGTFAGDMALAMWATGGVYLSGGMLGRLERFFDAERFRARFEDKGRFTRFCETVPVGRITTEHPGLLGCSAALTRGS